MWVGGAVARALPVIADGPFPVRCALLSQERWRSLSSSSGSIPSASTSARTSGASAGSS